MATKLFVGNLSYAVTDDMLEDFFKQAGTVVSAKVIVDHDSSRSKGFGFVEMSSDDEAKSAIDQLNGKELDGREVAVNEARPKQPRDNRQFGGDRNGNRRNDY